MEINNSYAWSAGKKSRDNNPFLPSNIRGLIVGKSNCGKTTLLINLLLQPGWLDYNHLYVYGKILHQREYKILKKGFESGLSKEQISNIFKNQEDIEEKMDPIKLIESYINQGGIVNGKIKSDFYNNCTTNNPDPTELNDEKRIYSYLMIVC